MGVIINADTDYLERASIPSGTTGTLSQGSISNFTVCGWYRRPYGVGSALMDSGSIIHCASGARDLFLYFDNTFGDGTEQGPRLQLDGDSGTINKEFGAGEQSTWNDWVFFALTDIGTRVSAIWSSCKSESVHRMTTTNTNASSQYVNTLRIGGKNTAAAAGSYSHWRAFKHGITLNQFRQLKRMEGRVGDEWGYWPLIDADPGDFSGHQRDLTIGGTVEASVDTELLRYLRGTKSFYIPFTAVQASGGQNINAGLASETDEALSLSRRKEKVVGLASTTDTALTATAQRRHTVGLATETDSALAATYRRQFNLGIATETDSPLAATITKRATLGLAAETDEALPLGSQTLINVGLATETDSPLAVAARKQRTAGLAAEADTALAATAQRHVVTGLATETDTALSCSVTKRMLLGLAAEIDSALGLELEELVQTWVSYARAWRFKAIRAVHQTTTRFKTLVTDALRSGASWTRWRPGTNEWSGSSNMQIDVADIPDVPPLRDNGSIIE